MAHRDQANRGSGSERQSVERTEDQRAAEEAGEGGREGRGGEGRGGREMGGTGGGIRRGRVISSHHAAINIHTYICDDQFLDLVVCKRLDLTKIFLQISLGRVVGLVNILRPICFTLALQTHMNKIIRSINKTWTSFSFVKTQSHLISPSFQPFSPCLPRSLW